MWGPILILSLVASFGIIATGCTVAWFVNHTSLNVGQCYIKSYLPIIQENCYQLACDPVQGICYDQRYPCYTAVIRIDVFDKSGALLYANITFDVINRVTFYQKAQSAQMAYPLDSLMGCYYRNETETETISFRDPYGSIFAAAICFWAIFGVSLFLLFLFFLIYICQ